MGRRPSLTRRRFIQVAGATGLASVLCLQGGCRGKVHGGLNRKRRSAASDRRVIVLGLDGFDPRLCERLMGAGKLPNLARLRDAGGYRPLGSSIPPQSPVAWASFITGADAGVHGIFDFIHRHPEKPFEEALYFGASETVGTSEGWDVGAHKLPLGFWPFNHATAHTQLKRSGTPFWEYLDAAGVPSCFYDLPSNYPPSPSTHGQHVCLAGMGTPDLLGSYGTHQVFSTRFRQQRERGGGLEIPLVFRENVASAKLIGPLNTLLKQPVASELPFQIYRHPTDALARIEIDAQTIVLKAGEWSDWRRVSFPLQMPSFLPDEHVSGLCRFYLQEVRPHFRLYVSPLNIDPAAPGEQRVSEPADFAARIADELGPFATIGFQEDHKALTHGVFTDEEYRHQAEAVLTERMNLLNYALEHYDDGLLFFYFSSTDLQSHMFWWDGDESHPTRSAADARKYMGVLEDLYARMDDVVGAVVRRYGEQATILVLSDHGFCNFRRQFSVNTWLRDNGYLGPRDCEALLGGRTVDWSQTRAYGLGINGLYLNLQGRERHGIVTPAERDALLNELRTKLLAVRDPENGEPALAAVYRADEVYHGPLMAGAPDLILGYRRGWRCGWDSTLGIITDEVFSDNKLAWCADHCVATEELPGVLFANKPITAAAPTLIDLAPTILSQFDVPMPKSLRGRNVFAPEAT